MNDLNVCELYQILSAIDNTHVSTYDDKSQSFFRQRYDAIDALIRICREQKLDCEDFKINRICVMTWVSSGGIRRYFKLEPFYGRIR